jgi:hypothetical protein
MMLSQTRHERIPGTWNISFLILSFSLLLSSLSFPSLSPTSSQTVMQIETVLSYAQTLPINLGNISKEIFHHDELYKFKVLGQWDLEIICYFIYKR